MAAAATGQPRVAAVVVTYNRRELLLESAEGLDSCPAWHRLEAPSVEAPSQGWRSSAWLQAQSALLPLPPF